MWVCVGRWQCDTHPAALTEPYLRSGPSFWGPLPNHPALVDSFFLFCFFVRDQRLVFSRATMRILYGGGLKRTARDGDHVSACLPAEWRGSGPPGERCSTRWPPESSPSPQREVMRRGVPDGTCIGRGPEGIRTGPYSRCKLCSLRRRRCMQHIRSCVRSRVRGRHTSTVMTVQRGGVPRPNKPTHRAPAAL